MAVLAIAAALFTVGPHRPVGESATGNAPLIAARQFARPAVRSVHEARVGVPIVQGAVPVRTPPLRTLAPARASAGSAAAELEPSATGDLSSRATPDTVVQRSRGSVVMPGPIMTFDGMAGNGPIPPDVEGDIGPNHYFQWLNISFTVYSRSGAALLGPVPGNSPFQSLGPSDLCRTTNRGDPIVLYDQLADRWVLSQFAYQLPRTGPYYHCIAISTSGDPTGSYCVYSYKVSDTVWNDYGKIGLWPDAYYVSFIGVPDSGTPKMTPVAWAVDRQKMLACSAADAVYFDSSNAPDLAGAADPMLPADLDGSTQPPTGQPNPYLMSVDGSPDRLSLFEFHVDWANPIASTFTKKADLPVPAFDTAFTCNTPNETRQCIPQPGTTTRLDALAKQLMKRLTYRRFADHESLVVNQTVDADVDHAGVRWYEVRDPHGTPMVYQASTYAPDAEDRWMGSAATDRLGDLAVGYSVSSNTTYPSLRYTGRPSGAPLGQLLDETTLWVGAGSQTYASGTGPARWGDYQSLSIDPVDDCTFWFAGEYYPVTANIYWHTRIGTFRFPACLAPTATTLRSFTARREVGTVVVRWRTASELDALGFNLYRSIGTGPFRKQNARLVRAQRAGTARGASYRVVDRSVRASLVYTYRLQFVDRRGRKTWYGIGVTPG